MDERNDKPRRFKPDAEAIAKYEAQIASLRGAFEKANTELSNVVSEREATRSEVAALQKRADTFVLQIAELEGKLETVRTVSIQTADRVMQEHQKISEKSVDLKSTVFGKLADEERGIRERVSAMSAEEKRLVNVLPKLQAKARKAESDSKKVSAAEKRVLTARQATKKMQDSMAAKIKAFAEQKAMVDIQTTKNEKDRSTIEQYVRRLQRYYDQKGIRLNILPKFGLK